MPNNQKIRIEGNLWILEKSFRANRKIRPTTSFALFLSVPLYYGQSAICLCCCCFFFRESVYNLGFFVGNLPFFTGKEVALHKRQRDRIREHIPDSNDWYRALSPFWFLISFNVERVALIKNIDRKVFNEEKAHELQLWKKQSAFLFVLILTEPETIFVFVVDTFNLLRFL